MSGISALFIRSFPISSGAETGIAGNMSNGSQPCICFILSIACLVMTLNFDGNSIERKKSLNGVSIAISQMLEFAWGAKAKQANPLLDHDQEDYSYEKWL
jgi:hypothetical protein